MYLSDTLFGFSLRKYLLKIVAKDKKIWILSQSQLKDKEQVIGEYIHDLGEKLADFDQIEAKVEAFRKAASIVS